MAENKKSIIVYAEWIELFEELEDQEAGRLIKHFFRYVNDQAPEAPDRITKLAFIPIQQTLKRDLKKYETYIDKQKANGKKGGRPKTQKTQAFILKPKKADNVNDNDNDNVNDIYLKEKETYNFGNELFNDPGWLENICRKNKIPMDQDYKIKKYLENFDTKLVSELENKTNKKDYASHFSRWVSIEIQKETTQAGEKKINGAQAFINQFK